MLVCRCFFSCWCEWLVIGCKGFWCSFVCYRLVSNSSSVVVRVLGKWWVSRVVRLLCLVW